jgi:hypothetical protein
MDIKTFKDLYESQMGINNVKNNSNLNIFKFSFGS